MKKFILFIFIIIITNLFSNNIVIGVGIDSNKEIAIEKSIKDLSNKIMIHIKTEVYYFNKEVNGVVESELEYKISLLSNIILKDLKQTIENYNNQYKVTTSISKNKIEDYFRIQEDNLKQYLQVAEEMKIKNAISLAIDNYYKAYLTSNLIYQTDFVYKDKLINNFIIQELNELVKMITIDYFETNLINLEEVKVDLYIHNYHNKYIEIFDGKKINLIKGIGDKYTFNVHIDYFLVSEFLIRLKPLLIDFHNDDYLKTINNLLYSNLNINNLERKFYIDEDYYNTYIKPNSIYDNKTNSLLILTVNNGLNKGLFSKSDDIISSIVTIKDINDKLFVNNKIVKNNVEERLYLPYGEYYVTIQTIKNNNVFVKNNKLKLTTPIVRKDYRK